MNLEEEIRIFLNEICTEFGLCNPLYNVDFFASRKYYEVNNFLKEIFLSEEMNPDEELRLFRQLKRKFTDRFGSEVSRS